MKNNLKQIRKVKGITQKQLADSLGISKPMVSMWENNPDEKIPQTRIKQICKYLRIEEEELHTAELDIKAIESKALKEEIVKLEQRYHRTEKERINDVVENMKTNHKEIENEISDIGDDTDKLGQVKRFMNVLNKAKISSKFDNVQPYGLDILVNGFLKLLEEEESPANLDILLKVVTYFSMGHQNPTESKRDFNEDDKFNSKFSNFLDEYSKLTGDD